MIRRYLPRVLALSDQVLFSLGGLALTIGFSRGYSHEEFAGYGTGISVALIVQGLQRGIYVIPTAVTRIARIRRSASGVVGEHVIALSAAALILMIAAAGATILGLNEVAVSTCYATLSLGLIYMQADFDRYLYSKFHKSNIPAFFSAIFAAMAGLLAYSATKLQLPYSAALVFLIVFALVKCVAATVLIARPNFKWGLRMLRKNLHLRGMFEISGAISYAAYNHLPVIMLTATRPPIETGAFVAMRSIVQPLQLLVRSFDIRDKHEFAEIAANPTLIRRTFWSIEARYFLIGTTAVVALTLFSVPLAHLIFANKYRGYEWVMAGHTVIFLFVASMLPFEALLVVTRRYRQSLPSRLASGVAGIVGSLFLCKALGISGALLTVIGGWLVSLIGMSIVLADLISWQNRERSLQV